MRTLCVRGRLTPIDSLPPTPHLLPRPLARLAGCEAFALAALCLSGPGVVNRSLSSGDAL
jgi:hypothetical protein